MCLLRYLLPAARWRKGWGTPVCVCVVEWLSSCVRVCWTCREPGNDKAHGRYPWACETREALARRPLGGGYGAAALESGAAGLDRVVDSRPRRRAAPVTSAGRQPCLPRRWARPARTAFAAPRRAVRECGSTQVYLEQRLCCRRSGREGGEPLPLPLPRGERGDSQGHRAGERGTAWRWGRTPPLAPPPEGEGSEMVRGGIGGGLTHRRSMWQGCGGRRGRRRGLRR
jgi:hypothetical protein